MAKINDTAALFSFVTKTMSELHDDLIGTDKAKAQANLAKQANNLLKYDLDRAITEIKVRTFNIEIGENVVSIRDIEGGK